MSLRLKSFKKRFPSFSKQISYKQALEKIIIQMESRIHKRLLLKNSVHLLEEMLLIIKQTFLNERNLRELLIQSLLPFTNEYSKAKTELPKSHS